MNDTFDYTIFLTFCQVRKLRLRTTDKSCGLHEPLSYHKPPMRFMTQKVMEKSHLGCKKDRVFLHVGPGVPIFSNEKPKTYVLLHVNTYQGERKCHLSIGKRGFKPRLRDAVTNRVHGV